jgi:hypothetical protein
MCSLAVIRRRGRSMDYKTPFVNYLIWAMEGRGRMTLSEINRAVLEQCERFDRPLKSRWQDHVRDALQDYCPTCADYKERGDYFINHEPGVWSCIIRSPNLETL